MKDDETRKAVSLNCDKWLNQDFTKEECIFAARFPLNKDLATGFYAGAESRQPEIDELIEELETAQETITRYRQEASMIKSAWEDAKIENKQLLEKINSMEAKNE